MSPNLSHTRVEWKQAVNERKPGFVLGASVGEKSESCLPKKISRVPEGSQSDSFQTSSVVDETREEQSERRTSLNPSHTRLGESRQWMEG
jgi:hypothetical protein